MMFVNQVLSCDELIILSFEHSTRIRVSPAVARGVAEIDIKTLARLAIGHSLHPAIRNPEFSVRDFNSIYVWLISLVAALSGLLFGDDSVVIGRARPFYEVFFHLTAHLKRAVQ
jgi:hypothetical protein